MLYNIAQLLKAQMGSDLLVQINEEFDLESETEILLEPVVGELRLQHTNQGILVTGECETAVELQCARCLEPFELPLTVSINELYRPTVEVTTGIPIQDTSDEDDSFTIDDHHHLDLASAIRQQILLSLPMQPICSENCKGLCPVCGANRNVTQCTCASDEDEISPDLPLSALAHLNLTPDPST